MANIQITDLDFEEIKNNLKNYLKDQNVLKDANYEGSVLSIILDLLAYNTHYNAYYLNMISNEMFLDTATKRNSIVSIAKMLGYTPSSKHSCKSLVNINITGLSVQEFTIPKFTRFISDPIDDIFYTFVTTTNYTSSVSNNEVTFSGVELVEGEPISKRNIYRKIENEKSSFIIPDINVDLNTLDVKVQKSSSDSSIQIYSKREKFNFLNGESLVYFIDETNDGFYEISFGDGILGKNLEDGNIIIMTYIVSSGKDSFGANTFTLIDPISTSYSDFNVTTTNSAFGGSDKESIESIKFSAPKYFASQNRSVTYQDYIAALMNNAYNFSFDSVNVWGGQDNDPPVYGQVFITAKPTGAFTLTTSQKEMILNKIIKPMSVLTVDPQIIDPDYIYLKLNIEVVYNPNKTTLTSSQIQSLIKKVVFDFSDKTLNTFNSVFSLPTLMFAIQSCDPSIITNDCKIFLEKKLNPNFQVPSNYTLEFGNPLSKGIFSSSFSSSPGMTFLDKTTTVTTIDGVYLEEVQLNSGGIDFISITNKGFGYKTTPSVVITGDGTGAVAKAVVVNGSIRSISVINPGSNYTSAKVEIIGDGNNAKAFANLEGRFGKLRLVYFNKNFEKLIYKENAGTIDYQTGKVDLINFNPLNINNPLAQLSLVATPKKNIFYSSKDKLITIDPFDNTSVTVNVVSKE